VGKSGFSKMIILIRKNNFVNFEKILFFLKRSNNFSLLHSQNLKKNVSCFYPDGFLLTDVRKLNFYEA